MEQRYYLRLGKKVRGPLSAEQFRRLRDTGKLPSATEYSTDRQVWGRIPESVAEIDEDAKDGVAEIDEDPEHAVAEIDEDVMTASRASTPPPVPRDALKTRAAPRARSRIVTMSSSAIVAKTAPRLLDYSRTR